MNRIQKEWLALRESAKIYLRYRRKPEEYYNNWSLIKSNDDFTQWSKTFKPKLVEFRNKYAGNDCFIIGNGPSLNQMELERLNDFYTFGLNKIFLIFKRVNLKLDFLVSVNPLVIEQSVEEFNKLKIPKFLSYMAAKEIGGWDEFTHMIFTRGGLESSWEITRPINEGFTVTNVALQVAYYLGFSNVFLIGVDHNFNQTGKPNEEQKMEGDDVNHFDPNYFKGQQWHLADLEGSEVAYRNTKFLFDRSNRKIFDATLNGKLQVFEKIDFDKALAKAKKK